LNILSVTGSEPTGVLGSLSLECRAAQYDDNIVI